MTVTSEIPPRFALPIRNIAGVVAGVCLTVGVGVMSMSPVPDFAVARKATIGKGLAAVAFAISWVQANIRPLPQRIAAHTRRMLDDFRLDQREGTHRSGRTKDNRHIEI
jgi:hypothetical protein